MEVKCFIMGFFCATLLFAALYFIYNIVTVLGSEDYQRYVSSEGADDRRYAESEDDHYAENTEEHAGNNTVTHEGSKAAEPDNKEQENKALSKENEDSKQSHSKESQSDDDISKKTDETCDDEGSGEPRILFVGDSRTIDMFDDSDEEITALSVGNGITVYAKHGFGFYYLVETVNNYGTDNFDMLVTWMGANDAGCFDNYRDYYTSLLNDGKKIVVCTVGPTDDQMLMDYDRPDYNNEKMVEFNDQLIDWANENGVKIIDLYSFIIDSPDVTIDQADGIHYLPRPTKEIWKYIISKL